MPYIKKLLPNGLNIFFIPIEAVKTFYACLYVKIGAFYEDESNLGISHFLEHHHHEGTISYPNHQLLSQAIEDQGMYENARTSLFYTLYWVASSYDRGERAVKFLYEIVFSPLLPENQLDKTKKIIINEINDFWSSPFNQFKVESFNKRTLNTTPYHHLAFGRKETVEKFSHQQIIEWEKKYYQPANMILTLTGNFSFKKMFPLIEKIFGKLKNKTKIKTSEKVKVKYSDFLVYHKDNPSDQIHFYLSFSAFGYREKSLDKIFQLYLFQYLLAQSRTARLSKILREENKLVYSISCQASCYPYFGELIIYGSCAKENLLKTIALIKGEIEKIKTYGFFEDEINKAKNLYERDVVSFNFETPQQIHSWIVAEFLYHKKIFLPEDYIRLVKKITKEDLQLLAKDVFLYDKLNVSLFGRLTEKEIREVKTIFVK